MGKRRTVKPRAIANTAIDPTLPNVPIEIQGKTYYLNFDLGALAEAKRHFASKGHSINLLAALAVIDIDHLMVLFPCAIHRHHPELSFEEAQQLLTLPLLYRVSDAVALAWSQSMPAPKVGDTTKNPAKP